MSNYIRPSMVAMTPLAMYKSMIGSSVNAVRYSGSELEFIPLQFGGIKGQAEVLSQGIVLKIVDFKTENVEE